MIGVRTIRRRMFAAIFAVALLPAAVALFAGSLLLGGAGATSGTLGPWDAVASSGDALAAEVLRAAPEDSVLASAAATHRAALSESLRRSQVWVYVAERFRRVLPALALASVLFVGLTASLAAALLARSFAGPIDEMVEWTGRIARGEPLPAREPGAPAAAEIEQLRGSLRQMAGELDEGRRRGIEQARLKAWTEMARRVAHDLKNPLTPMRLAAAQLARGPDPGVQAPAEVLLAEIGRLDEMARAFASLGRPPESPVSQVDLGELLGGLARRHQTEEVPILVHSGAPTALVRGHLDLLERVFRNLIVNAIEASQDGPGGRIEVEVERADGRARVLIRDHGPGLPQGFAGTIWLPEVTTKARGTGLGLAIVRQGVEVHGGSVSARDAEGGGTVFEVELPVDGPSGLQGDG